MNSDWWLARAVRQREADQARRNQWGLPDLAELRAAADKLFDMRRGFNGQVTGIRLRGDYADRTGPSHSKMNAELRRDHRKRCRQ